MPVPGTITGLTGASPARAYDYLLGGRDNFAADRDLTAAVADASPHPGLTRELAWRNRLYLDRAAAWARAEGCRQFLDLGAGLPVSGRQVPGKGTLRDIRESARGAAVVSVDADPAVVRHGNLLAGGYVHADLADAGAVLGHEGVTGAVDFSRPAGIILGFVAHFLPADAVREAASAYLDAVAPGSFLILTVPVFGDGEAWERLRRAYTAAPMYSHTMQDVRSFFAGAQLLGGGVEVARDLRPETLAAGPPCVLAGVARKGRP